MKRLIVCCDGSWQRLDSPYPTNVVKIAQAIKPSSSQGIPQIVFYDEGVGAGNAAGKLLAQADIVVGGAFGAGIDINIQDGYRFLCLNYEPGDEIYLFGFSRGAYTVRSLAGLIRCSGGLLSLVNIREAPFAYEIYRDSELNLQEKESFRKLPIPYEYKPNVNKIKECRSEAHKIYSDRSRFSLKEVEEDRAKAEADLQQKEEKVRNLLNQYSSLEYPLLERDDSKIRQATNITLLGCWDTVGAIGIPSQFSFLSPFVNKKYQFHDIVISSRIKYALHAIAIDEIREVFDVSLMERAEDDSNPLHQVWFPGGHGSVGGGSKEERGLSDAALQWMMDEIRNFKLGLEFEPTAAEDGIKPNHMKNFNNQPEGIYKLLRTIKREIPRDQFEKIIHESAKRRWHDCPDYRPGKLEEVYGEELNAWKP